MGKPLYYFGKCLFTLGRPFFPTKVIGKENIRESGKVIYASNHLSAIDIPLIQVHCPGYRRYIGKKEYGEKCVRRFLLSHFGVIFIDRDKPELSVMRQIFKVLDGGQIVIFPEGTRNHGDPKEMLELKTGLAVFAAKSGAPVLPVVIWRKPRILRKNYMYIGEPVVLPESGRMPDAATAERLTEIYAYEFAKCRVILEDAVANKRWKKKNRLPAGVKSPALESWESENPDPRTIQKTEATND